MVECGVATVTGGVALHSTERRLVRTVRAVDGVVAVESHVNWEEENVIQPVIS